MDSPKYSAESILRQVSDDGLRACTDAAVSVDDKKLMHACAIELERRCLIPVSPVVVHDLPAWLHWLPRLFWHQKPVGEGRGPS